MGIIKTLFIMKFVFCYLLFRVVFFPNPKIQQTEKAIQSEIGRHCYRNAS